jgi:hypothetical protein
MQNNQGHVFAYGEATDGSNSLVLVRAIPTGLY